MAERPDAPREAGDGAATCPNLHGIHQDFHALFRELCTGCSPTRRCLVLCVKEAAFGALAESRPLVHRAVESTALH